MQFTSTGKVISLIVCNKIVVADSEDRTKHKDISRVQCRDSRCFSRYYLLPAIALYSKGSCVSSYEGWNFNSGNYLFTTDTK